MSSILDLKFHKKFRFKFQQQLKIRRIEEDGDGLADEDVL
jgi:hypothetical protein